MSNNKQSSVDWLKSTVKSMIEQGGDADLYAVLWHIEQAKAMHKEEVKTCMSVAFIDGARSNDENYKSPHEEWDDYYNEAFGGANEN
jgi:hypothetical protein